jgi:hypothetical protein
VDPIRLPSTPLPPSVEGVAPRRAHVSDIVPVTLFEDMHGRLVVVDARGPRESHATDGPLLRIGRTRLALHHLAPPLRTRLADHGAVTVEGQDALNVLLAFADAVGSGGDDPG